MISRKAKALFYQVAGPAMYVNGLLYKHLRSPEKGLIKVQLGPGQKNYLEGWINVDANMFTGKCDVWADIRNPLPFRDEKVDFFYSHHVIEHLPDLQLHFNELYRCLKPGGKIRVAGPNGDVAIQKFVENDSAWFSDFPDKRESIGGRFENYIFCRGEHMTILTWSYLNELAVAAGFKNLRLCKPITETGFPEFVDAQVLSKEWESTPDHPHTIIIEAEK